MAKEIERAGIPTAQICNMTAVAQQVGANRIVPSVSVLHPTGEPRMTLDQEKGLRRAILLTALRSLETPLEGQKVFE